MAWSGSKHSQSRCLCGLSTAGGPQRVMLKTDMKVQNGAQGDKALLGLVSNNWRLNLNDIASITREQGVRHTRILP